MRVLIACEYSGRVRDAFIAAGHDAISCDMLPSESDAGPHYQAPTDGRSEAGLTPELQRPLLHSGAK